jgi:hypothetical protein
VACSPFSLRAAEGIAQIVGLLREPEYIINLPTSRRTALTSRFTAAAPKPGSCALAPSMPHCDSSLLIDACHLQAALAVWDYRCDSARLLFDSAPIGPTSRRISQSLNVTPEGLSRVQIRVTSVFSSFVAVVPSGRWLQLNSKEISVWQRGRNIITRTIPGQRCEK